MKHNSLYNRKNKSIAALFAVALMQFTCPVLAKSYNNPVIGDPKSVDREVPDPHVLKWNGEYYLYTSGDPITAYHSTDLIHWDSIGPVLSSSPKKEAWNQADVWAPEVVYRNGKFYMYYTASKKSEDWRVGEMARRLGVAVSDSPRGPFVDLGKPVTPGWGIDGNVFKDPANGKEYFFYSYLYEPRMPGAGIVVDPLTSWNSVTGKIYDVTHGTEAWEDKDGDPNNGSLRYTNEGPTVIKHHDLYYMMYSGGSWDLPTYSLAYAVSDNVLNGWKKVLPPILRSNSFVDGPGHNTMVKAPNNIDDICIYHARTIPFIEPWNRLPFVDRLYWHHDNMYMQQPTLADLPAPDKPVFYDNFDKNNLSNMWQNSSGNWQVTAGQLKQNSFGMTTLISRSEKLTNYIFEANLKTINLKNNSGAAIGVSAYYIDSNNYIDVWLSSDNKKLITNGKLNGKNIAEQSAALPADFDFNDYHQMIISKNDNQINIDLDGVNKQSRRYDINPDTAVTVALKTNKSQALFDGIALTSYYEDTFDSPDNNWQQKAGTWLSEEGALDQVEGGSSRSIALKGQDTENYEFNASMKLRDNDSSAAKLGIVAAADKNGKMVIGGFDKTIWPQARFHVQYLENNTIKQNYSVGLPRGFDYNIYHTIRLVKQGSGFTFFLDGKEIMASRFNIGAAKPGLFTEASRAAFDDVSMKKLVVPQNLVLNPGFETEQWDGSSAAEANPWSLSGNARLNECCGHSGQKRLIINGANGSAKQTITGIMPGRYKLSSWIMNSDNVTSQLSVSDFGGTNINISANADKWTKYVAEFTVSKGHSSATIAVNSVIKSGSNGLSAFDDFYLSKED